MKYRTYDPGRSFYHKRKSIRLPTHDYTWTRAYFVTIRAKICEPPLDHPFLRTILVETWESLPERFLSLTLDEFVVMPDHIHFILHLNGLAEHAPTLGAVVGAYKSLVVVQWLRHIKTTQLECQGRFWQRNYFERILCNHDDLEQTRQYIRDNPIRLQQKLNTEHNNG